VDNRFTLQSFEPEQLDITVTATPTGNRIFDGIEYDNLGRPVAYYVKTDVPQEFGMSLDYARIPADRVSHFYMRDRPSARRGVSDFVTGAIVLHDMQDAQYAELTSLRVQSYAGLHYQPNESELGNEATPFGAGFTDEATSTAPGGEVSTPNAVEWEPGVAFEYDGTVKLLDSNRPGNQFLPFMSYLIHQWAVNMGVPPFVVEGDYSKANFSSARMAELHCYPVFEERQTIIIERLHRIVKAWLVWAAMTGEVSLRGRTPEQVMREVEWIRPGFPYVQPEQEIRADLLKRASGVMTFDQHCARMGKNGREQRAAIKRAQEWDAEFGVDTSVNPDLVTSIAVSVAPSSSEGGADNQQTEDAGNMTESETGT
jgi:lambda family phage portal protein